MSCIIHEFYTTVNIIIDSLPKTRWAVEYHRPLVVVVIIGIKLDAT